MLRSTSEFSCYLFLLEYLTLLPLKQNKIPVLYLNVLSITDWINLSCHLNTFLPFQLGLILNLDMKGVFFVVILCWIKNLLVFWVIYFPISKSKSSSATCWLIGNENKNKPSWKAYLNINIDFWKGSKYFKTYLFINKAFT